MTNLPKIFLDDVYDHIGQVISEIDVQRDQLNGLVDLFFANQNNHMNAVMKTLTIVGAIFIPLTFIAGIYGMNFQNMPELQTENGYFVVLGVMLVLGVGMFLYMKLRRWF